MGALARKLTGESSKQRKAERRILKEQKRQFDLTREDFAGFRERGEAAGIRLNEFLGLEGQEAEQAAIAGFEESPGQVFLRQRQERALTRNAAALGGLGGGNVRTALQEQAFGIASQQLGERKNRLAQVAGFGFNATQAGATIGAGISGQTSQILTGFEQRRAAQSAGDRQSAAAAATAFIAASDRRFKRNIKRIGTTRDGYPWYSFDYLTGQASEGVMSDEVPSDMVIQIGGYDFVDYSRIK